MPLLACASQPPTSAPPVPEPASLEERLAENPEWRPGDSEPVEREVMRLEKPSHREGAKASPLGLGTVIRNRCGQPVQLVIGPEQATVGPDTPTTPLGPGEAVWVWLFEHDWVHLKDPNGDWRKAHAPGGHVIVERDAACDHVIAVGP